MRRWARLSTPSMGSRSMPEGSMPQSRRQCQVRELGRIGYGPALELQHELTAARKAGTAPDHLLLLEHPHVITLGRNGHEENLLASSAIMERAGIEFFPCDRGGDVTYHGPGQLVAYPIMDL